MAELFPNGLAHYIVGGLITGVAAGGVYALVGRATGFSSILTAVQSIWSRRPFFRQDWVLEDRAWKSVLVVGLIVGAGIWVLVTGDAYVTTVQPWRLALGGLLVGFGTRMARGCTSGHGICGVSAVAVPSVASTLAFVGTAMLVAKAMSMLGVVP